MRLPVFSLKLFDLHLFLHFVICSKNIFKELQFLIQLLDPEQQGWAAVSQAEGQLWDCQRGRPAGLSSVSKQFDKMFWIAEEGALQVSHLFPISAL